MDASRSLVGGAPGSASGRFGSLFGAADGESLPKGEEDSTSKRRVAGTARGNKDSCGVSAIFMGSALIDLAHQSPDAAVFEARALELLRRDVGFDVAFFATRDSERRPSVMGLPDRMVERIMTRGAAYAEDLLPVKRAALAARGVSVDTAVLGFENVERTRYFREIAAPLGGRHSLMAYVPWQGRIVAAVMLGRTGRAFSPRAVRRMETLLPVLGATRAAFGLPLERALLRPLASPGLLERFGVGLGRRTLEARSARSGELLVRDRHGYREMIARENGHELVWTRAALDEPTASGWPYVELFHVAAALATQRERALFVGCGGGVAPRQFSTRYPGIRIDVVEREAAVVELARRWFDLDAIPALTAHVAEGAEFVSRAPTASWDIMR